MPLTVVATKTITMKFSLIYSVFVLLAFLVACGGDDSGGGANVEIGVRSILSTDVENNGNASDIRVTFNISVNEDRVDHYRIIVVKNGNRSEFDLPTAEALSEISYERIEKTGRSIETVLSAQLTDADGDEIIEATAYAIFVLAVGLEGTESVLRSGSAQILLSKTDILEIMVEMPIGTGGLIVDEAGNIYCADFGASLGSSPGTTLYKITPGGQASVFARGFNGASGNTIGPDGNIYQSNIAGGRVSKVTMDGTVSTYVSGMSSPVGVVFDNAGNLYVANCGDNSIRKVDPNGNASIFVRGSMFNCPNGITIDNAGNLYVANFGNGNVVKITPGRTTSVLATLPGGNLGHLTFHRGDLYVVARAANQIYKVTLGGGAVRIVGSGNRGHDEGPALLGELSLPNDLGFSPDGEFLYINDTKPLGGTPANSQIRPTMLKRVRLEKN